MGDTPSYRVRRDAERQARLDEIAQQLKAGALVIRKLSTDDLQRLDRARERRLGATVDE
jgi:hypothetical protein